MRLGIHAKDVTMIMSEKGTTSTEKAMRILQRAESRKVTLRLVGGMAIRLHCHGTHSSHLREYGDIDVCGLKKEEMGIFAVLQELSYSPNSRFNLLYGETRLQFIHEGDNRSVDVFLDKFKMEHTLDFRKRLELDDLTISVTDLLLTKLQIVRITEKDLRDIVAIVEDHELGRSDNRETINLDYIAELCSRDWGLHKTVTGNLKMMSAHIEEVLPGFKSGSDLVPRLDTILKSILARQKTVRWRVRNLIGEKMRWYEIVSVGEGEVY